MNELSYSSSAHAMQYSTMLAVMVMLMTATVPAVAVASKPTVGQSLAASTLAPPSNATGALRVDVEPAIVDADLLPAWIRNRNPNVGEELSSAHGHEQWIAVMIGGATYDYRVSVVPMQDGKPVGAVKKPETCECNSERLLELIDERIAEATVVLGTAGLPADAWSTTVALKPDPGGSGSRSTGVTDRRRRMRPLASVGLGVGVLGVGLLGAGIPLVLRDDQIRGTPKNFVIFSTHGAGMGLAVGGGIALAAGVSLVTASMIRERKREIVLAPMVESRQVGFVLTWRARGKVRP